MLQAAGYGSHSPGFLTLLVGNAKMPQALVFNSGELDMHKNEGTLRPSPSRGSQTLGPAEARRKI